METAWLDRPDGMRLRIARWRLPHARARCLVLTGRTEFVEKYEEVAGRLRDRGFDVWSFDWRGQGLSSRHPDAAEGAGHIDDFETYLADLAAVRAHAAQGEGGDCRWIALGHSMGGHLLLRHLAAHGAACGFASAIVTSPMIRFPTGWPLPVVRRLAARALRRGRGGLHARRRTTPTAEGAEVGRLSFEENRLTRDPERFARALALVAADPRLHVGGVTWSWLAAAIRSCDILTQSATRARIETPLLIVTAGEDEVVLSGAAERFARGVPAARFLRIEGARHEILMEIDAIQTQFWSMADSFLDEK